MKLNKRILSIFTLVTIILSLFSVTAVYADEQYSYFLLRTENFTLPELWTLQSDASKYANALPGMYLKSSKAGPAAETSIYVTQEGDYVVWAMVCDVDDASFGKRHAVISIDGEKDDQSFGSTVRNGFSWTRSKKAYYLTPGLHTIELGVGYPSTMCSAVFVTNNLDFVLNEETVYTDIEKYTDLKKPTFTGDIEINKDSFYAFSVTFPIATDNNEVAGYQYYVDGEAVEPDENNSYSVQGLLPLTSHSVVAKAFDMLGNLTEVSIDANLYDWKMTDVRLKTVDDFYIDGLEELSSEDTAVKVELSVEKHLGGLQRPYVFAGIYTKDESRMLSSVMTRWNATGTAGNVISKSVELEVKPEVLENSENYIIKVMLVDNNTNIMPHIYGGIIGKAVDSQ